MGVPIRTEAHFVSFGSEADQPRAEARWARAKGHAPKPKRTMSASARRKIAAAQRVRWAKVKAQQKKAA